SGAAQPERRPREQPEPAPHASAPLRRLAMGASVGRSGRKRFRDINVTPLVDVMLVLLVVFMVTAPLLTTGLKIDLPNVQAASTPVQDGRLLVTITAEGRV